MDHDFWYPMYEAIEASKRSIPEDLRIHPAVGASCYVGRSGEVLTSFRGDLAAGAHAEYGLLERASRLNINLSGSTIYTTLEPCTKRGADKIPCCERLINSGIRRVVIGALDPNPSIRGRGVINMMNKGIDIIVAPVEYYYLIRSENWRYFEIFDDESAA